MIGETWVARARGLIGTRFRAQGRDPSCGLDCVGLACLVYGVPGRDDYRLRGAGHGAALTEALKPDFRRIARTERRPGDLMVYRPARDRWHLAVLTRAGIVHADARIGTVVETPGAGVWPLSAVYRRRVQQRKS